MNVGSGFALYQKNSDERIAPASTAKMLTALTVLDHCSPDDVITVGAEIELIASDSSTAGLSRGNMLTVKQLLVALLFPSGNDAAYTLAVNVGKKIANDGGLGAQKAVGVFIDAMNQKAKGIGANSSNFVTTDGYDASGQYTTAFDLARIAKAFLGVDILSEIARFHKISDTWISGQEVTYINGNDLLDPNSQYYYANAIGLKTGTTGDAGSCLVSAAVIDGQTYICVVMGSSAESRYTDSLAIYRELDPALTASFPTATPA
jgi:D-alanyl-D-alanine carboxypeptidase (penicillin-binding protein 5/6)